VVSRAGRAVAVGGSTGVSFLTDRPGHLAFNFEAEFRAAYPTLWVLAAGIVLRRSDADDVVQEAAIIALQKLDSFRPGSNFRAWMGEIVRNVALNHRRGERRLSKRMGARVDAHEHGIATKSDRPEGTGLTMGALDGLREQLDDHLAHALLALDPIVRTCVLLRCVEGLSYREISLLMAIPEGTAMSNVFRGRGTLASSLNRADASKSARATGGKP